MALRRRQAANLEPIIVSDDETSQYVPVEETGQKSEAASRSMFSAALVQLVQVVCSICGMLGHAADKCQFEPFEENRQSASTKAPVQLTQSVCPDCGILGHTPDECQFEPSEELAPEDEELHQYSEEDPSEHFEPMEEDDPEDELSVEQDVSSDEDTVPAILAWYPYCGLSGYHAEDCIYAIEGESD